MYVSNLRAEPNACGGQIDLRWNNPSKAEFPNFKGVKIVRRERRFPEVSPPTYSTDNGGFLYDGTLIYDKKEYFEEEKSFSDKGLHRETIYYYTFYTYDDNSDTSKIRHFTSRTSCIATMTTSKYGLEDELYRLLPAIYKRYDTQGELQRFLEIFGGQLDLAKSSIAGTRNFFDLDTCDGALLPLLAQWIGWQINLSQDLNSQRNEIRYAPELYRTVGTVANLRALVNRLTNWDSQIKEFVHNIFLSNSPEQLTVWKAERHAGNWQSTKLVTLDVAYEGKLATVSAQDGRKWLFYHARSSAFRQHTAAEEGTTNDCWHIWYKICEQTEWSPACRLTFDREVNKYPAALQKTDGNFWVFWSAYEEIEGKSIQQIKLNLLSAGKPATPARLQGTQAGPFAFAEGDQFKITVDDGIARIVTFGRENFPDIGQVSTTEAATFLNRALPDVEVIAADDGTIVLTSLTAGLDSAMTVPDSIVATKLGLATPVVEGSDAVAAELIGSRIQPFSLAGTRLVIRVDQDAEEIIDFTTESSASEVATTINSVILGIAQDDSGKIRLTSPTEGEAPFIGVNVDSSTAAPELGFGAPLPSETSPTDDIEPAVVEDDARNVWLFWSSRRTGTWKIWYNRFDVANYSWGSAKPLTEGLLSDREPAVLFDSGNSGKILVFWSRKKTNGLWNIFHRATTNLDFDAHTDSDWTEHELHTENDNREPDYDRKEPAAILLDTDNIELYFSSNRTGSWNIWYKSFNKALDDWTAEVPATLGHFTKKGPAILEDEKGSIWLLFRSNESIAYSSKVYPSTTTIDSRYSGSTAIGVRNKERIGGHGKLDDIMHYTYDTGRKNEDWYARDTIGIYLIPDTEDQQLITRGQELVEGILDRFLPIQLRAVFIINPIVSKELIYTYDFPAVKPQRLINEQFFDNITSPASEVYLGLTDSHKDKIPDWIWLRSWNEEYPDHHSVDFAATPIETKFRTWHIGLE